MIDDLYEVRYGNIKIFLRKSVVADYWVFEGLFFADEYFPLKLEPNDIILDVGANIGIFTLKVAKKVKQVISLRCPKETILKMDVEEYEGKVLSNFKNHGAIRQVVIETHSRDLTIQVTSILSSWGLTVTDISRIKRSRVLKNLIFHPVSFLSAEKNNHFSTLKQTIKYLVHHSESPVAADNPDSDQRILYAFKK